MEFDMVQQTTLKIGNMEKRKYPRWTWHADVQGLYVDEQGHRVVEQLQALDISRRGLGAVGSKSHRVGEKFVITLPEPDGRNRYVHAKVVRCNMKDDGAHLGLEFNDFPTELGAWLNVRMSMAA